MRASMLSPMSEADEDFDTPILAGGAPSDYERYLNTEELLALQKGPDEWVHRDELLFQVVHQSSELWLKLATSDVEEATQLVDAGDEVAEGARLLRRPLRCLRYATDQLDMLEELSPWEYQEIRKVLGHGSGFDSPGWRGLRDALPRLGQAFHARRRERRGSRSSTLYVQRRDHEALYRLAESMIELDEWCQQWRVRHYRVVARVIGDSVVGTQGTPGRGARKARADGPLPGALGRPQRAHGPVEGRIRLTLREEVTELLRDAPPSRHRQPAGKRDARRHAAAAIPRRRTASRASSSRRRPTARTSSRGSPGATGRAPPHGAHRHRARGPGRMARDPWSGDLVDGEIWGRGALDMKGHVAAAAVAFASLVA